MTTLTTLSDLREMRTVYKGGAWHFKNGVRRDNIGDFTLGVVVVGDVRYWILMARMGTYPPAGSLWWTPYDVGPYEGWTQGMPPGTIHEPPTKTLVLPVGAINIDTHCWVQNPLYPQRITFVHAVRDARTGLYHLERATADRVSPNPADYTRYHAPITMGEECSLVIDPYALTGVLFYVKKSQEPRDAYGMTFRARLYRRTVDLLGFDTEFRVGPEELVHEPSEPEQGAWGTANGIMQPGICILPGGRYLMTRLGRTPFRQVNGDPAMGRMNATTAVGLWISDDQGRTWKPIEGNPVLSREWFGLVDGFANQINSPHPLVDPFANEGRGQVYFACQLHCEGEVNQPGSRLVLAELEV